MPENSTIDIVILYEYIAVDFSVETKPKQQ